MYAKIVLVFLNCLCLMLSVRAFSSELDCESSYFPETGKIIIPCVDVGEAVIFHVEMHQKETNGNQISFDVDRVNVNTSMEVRALIIKAFKENTSIQATIIELEQSGYESQGIKIVNFAFLSGIQLNSVFLVIESFVKDQYPPEGTSVFGVVTINGRNRFEVGGIQQVELREVSK